MVQRVASHFIGRTGDEFGNGHAISPAGHPVAFPNNAGFENQTVFKRPAPLIENGDGAVGDSFKQAEINRIGHISKLVEGNNKNSSIELKILLVVSVSVNINRKPKLVP